MECQKLILTIRTATKIGFFAGTYRKTQMMTLKGLRKGYAIEWVEIV